MRGRNLTNDRLGSNGAGKSTFFSDAVTWCLYGRTVGGLRTTDLKSWSTKKPPRVAVGLGQHAVQRGPRATDLTIDGRAVGQEDVEALIGLSYEAWCQAVILGQGAPLFFDLAPAAKMGLLSDALGLERWERRAQAAGARARRLEDRLRGVEGEVRGLQTALEAARDALGKARDAAERWGREYATRLEEIASRAKSERTRASSLEEKRGEAALTADSTGTRAKLLRPDVQAAREVLATLRREQHGLERDLAALSRELDEAQKQLASFQKKKICPTCGQPVGKGLDTHVHKLEAQIARLTKSYDAASGGVVVRTREISSHAEALQKNEDALRTLEETEARATGGLRLLEQELAAAQARAAASDEARRRTEGEENPHRNAAQEARRHLREAERELAEKEKLAAQLAASAERAQFWARGFREIRLGVIDDVLDDLRGTTAEVLDGLGLGDWVVEYTTEREAKSGAVQRALAVTVRSPAAPEGARWEVYSGGERQRLRLAGALALSEVLLAHAGASLDFRVLDEPTRGLSREGVGDLVEMLGDYAERAGLKIFYVDHASEEGLAFASTTTVVNGPGGARIE